MNKSMILVTSAWGSQKTFKMIPASVISPYNEVIFDPESKVLALISKEKKESLHMLAKLTDMGDPQILKIGKRQNGKDYAEERRLLETYYEYFVENKSEISDFINMFALNADSFDFAQYLDAAFEPATKKSSIVTI